MSKQPYYEWDESLGVAYCVLTYKDKKFRGEASCHPEDKDLMSRLTGQIIAEYRATIEYLTFIRDFELRPQLQSLNHVFHCMKNSKYFDKKSYEARMLFRHINLLQKDIDTINEEIAITKQNLKEYIERKNKDHELIRKKRQDKALAEDNQ